MKARLLSLGDYVDHRMSKIIYYVRHVFLLFRPAPVSDTPILIQKLNEIRRRADYQALLERVDYYCKISKPFALADAISIDELIRWNRCRIHKGKSKNVVSSLYFFDAMNVLRYFNSKLRFMHAFGDNSEILDLPGLVKSRPIAENNETCIILKLEALRHFKFIKYDIPFTEKLGVAVFRGSCHQEHRQLFIDKCHNLPNTNIGDVRKRSAGKAYYKTPLSIRKHLQYKYIISIEGNDVATNLKWIMSSNSLCFMTKPKIETWFMEGLLVPGFHFVQLADDYSDLSEKIDYYNQNTDKALQIINNAHQWIEQFCDHERELAIGILVANRYFDLSISTRP